MIEFTSESAFEPSRLTEAREGMGLTKTALAKLINRSPQSISLYENGERIPQTKNLIKIAKALGFPLSFFTTSCMYEVESCGTTFFRSVKSTRTRKEQILRARRNEWYYQITEWLRKYIEFPPLQLPDLGLELDRRCTCMFEEKCNCGGNAYSEESIEEAAYQLRTSWGLGLGPISNMVDLLESKGIIVLRQKSKNMRLDAVSQKINGRAIILLSDDKTSAVRSRFDAAHELGHLILHDYIQQEDLTNSAVLKQIESEANLFASAFLLPEKSFSQELYGLTLGSFEILKKRWLVSMQAMIIRAYHIGAIDEATREKLFIQISARGFRRKEPLDDLLDPEKPQLVCEAWRLLIEHDIVKATDILEDLKLPIDIVAKTLSVDPSDLEPEHNVVNLKIKEIPDV